MPFNKGDFTQQGVAGHVNANLRLNEKRLVNIDLTSNEEAEGCTITGTVKDLLNDKVYGIGAGVSGNIEITENGENINVAPYATATVNVSGGGGDTANITFVPTYPNSEIFDGLELGPIQLSYSYEIEEETITDVFRGTQAYYNLTTDPIVTIPVLDSAMVYGPGIKFYAKDSEDEYDIDPDSVVVTGNGYYDVNSLVVTGDCTVTCTLRAK